MKMLIYLISSCLCIVQHSAILCSLEQFTFESPYDDSRQELQSTRQQIVRGIGDALGATLELGTMFVTDRARDVGLTRNQDDKKNQASAGSWLLGIDEKKTEAWGRGLTTGLLDEKQTQKFGKMLIAGMLASITDPEQARLLRQSLLRMVKFDEKEQEGLGADVKQALEILTNAAWKGINSGLADKKEAQEMRRNILRIFPGGEAWADWADRVDAMDPKTRDKYMNNIPNTIIGSIFNAQNGLRIAGYTSLTLGALVGTWYGVKLGFKRLERNMTKPTILLPDSHVGLRDSLKRWRSGYITPAIIMSPQLKKRFKEIVHSTKITLKRIANGDHVTFDNILLVGPPGTGKSLFARMLADRAGMYYAATTGGALLQSSKGVEHLHEIMALGRNSKRGVIVFVDEADSFLINRNNLDPSSLHAQVTNEFLALTGQGCDVLVIFATNHAEKLDPALARRFQHRIDMELPTLDERKQLVELCIKQIIFNTKHNSAVFIKHAREFIQQDDIAQRIANRTEGLSHAELDNLVSAMYKKALLSRNKRLTLEHAREATKEAVGKYERFKSDHQVQVKNLQGG